jgi:hypothetical protein
MKVGNYPEPCETFDRGEVEDYTINFRTGGAILKKDNFNAYSFTNGQNTEGSLLQPITIFYARKGKQCLKKEWELRINPNQKQTHR